MAEPVFFATSGGRATPRLGHDSQLIGSKQYGGWSDRALLPRVTAFAFLGGILANSLVKTKVKLLCFTRNSQDGEVNANFKARW
jgi:hypothetical protein